MMRDSKQEIEELLQESRALRLIRASEMGRYHAISKSIRDLARKPYSCVVEPQPGVQVLVTGASLSVRDKQVLRLMLEGDSIKEIAGILELTPATVGQYAKRLYRKLGVHSRGELAARGRVK